MKYGSFNPDVLIGGDGITNDAVWLERLQKFVNIRWDDSPNPNPRPPTAAGRFLVFAFWGGIFDCEDRWIWGRAGIPVSNVAEAVWG